MKKYLILLLTLLLLPVLVGATNYYVRTDGSDTNNGLTNDASGAWLTINYAQTQIADLDSVFVEEGTYIEAFSSSFGLYIGASKDVDYIANGSVIIKSDEVAGTALVTFGSGTKNTTFNGFIFDGNNKKKAVIYAFSGCDNKTFIDCTMYGSTSIGNDATIINSNGWVFTGCTFGSIGGRTAIDLTGHTITVEDCSFSGTHYTGLYLHGATGVTGALITIDDNSFSGTELNVITFGASTGCEYLISNNTITTPTIYVIFEIESSGDYTFSGNTISGINSLRGVIKSAAGFSGSIKMYNENYDISVDTLYDYITIVEGSFSIDVRDCDFYFDAIDLDRGIFNIINQDTTYFSGNTFTTATANSSAHIFITSTGSSTGGAKVVNNTFYSKSLTGYIVVIGADGTSAGDHDFDGYVFSGNKLFGAAFYDDTLDPSIHAVMLGYNVNGIITNNYINGTGLGMVMEGTDYTFTSGGVSNNVFINNTYADVIMAGIRDLNIVNNTIVHTKGESHAGIFISDNIGGAGDTFNPNIKNNIIYSTIDLNAIYIFPNVFTNGLSSDYNCIYINGGFKAVIDDTTYTSLESWQTKMNDAANSINTDPLLVNEYETSKSSPCRGVGETLANKYGYQIKAGTTFPNPELEFNFSPWWIGAVSNRNFIYIDNTNSGELIIDNNLLPASLSW